MMGYHLPKKYIPIKNLVPLLLASLAIFFVFSVDLIILDISLFAETLPNFNVLHLLRSSLIVLGSGLFVIFVIQFHTLEKSQDSILGIWDNWGLIIWSTNNSTEQNIVSLRVKELVVWMVLLLSLFFLFLFLMHPAFFSKLGHEGNPVETISATLYFFNCGLFIYISFLLFQQLSNTGFLYLIISFSFGFVFFLIGMEEISWFQRILSVEPPDLFRENMQNEMNLHNFATNKIENAYYFTSFAFLIFLPFIKDKFFLLKNSSLLSFFSPSLFVLFVSAVFVSYNYDMWNILFTQLSFFVTFFILVHYIWLHLRLDDNGLTLLAVFIIFVLTQALFLVFGHRFLRVWDVTEYKELFIPLAFLIYSLEILKKTKSFQLD